MDKNNVELQNEVNGNFYPSTQSELLRNLILKSPFNVNGGIFATNIKNIGVGIVHGPVLATEEITFEAGQVPGNPLRFMAGINATMSIAVMETGKPPEESVIGDLNKAGIIVNGDIISNYVKLENTLVFGNIRAKQVSIVNSVILGAIFADDSLRLENSIFGSFQTGKAKLHGINGWWLPFAISSSPVEFETSSDGRIAEVHYLPIILGNTGSSNIINYYEKLMKSKARIFPSDVFQDNTQNGDIYYILSLAKRALNFRLIERDVQKIKLLIMQLSLYEHLDASSKEEAQRVWDKELGIEKKLLELAFPY
jgi:hypothetical protein